MNNLKVIMLMQILLFNAKSLLTNIHIQITILF